LRLAGLPWRC